MGDGPLSRVPTEALDDEPTGVSSTAAQHKRRHSADNVFTERLRVAVYGGAFNPITNAHLNVAAEIIHSELADEVWIVPSGPRPDKPALKTSYGHRMIMCHLAVDTTFGSKFPVFVCDEEQQYPIAVPSIVLMRLLQAKHPNKDFVFVIGSDLVEDLEDWRCEACPGHWDKIDAAGKVFVQENNFLVIRRPGSDLTQELPEQFTLIKPATEGATLVTTTISSTEVRRRIQSKSDTFRQREPLKRQASLPPDLSGTMPVVTPPQSAAQRSKRARGIGQDGSRRTPNYARQQSADEVVRHRLTPRVQRSRYQGAEGLVPSSVLGHIIRYNLYPVD